MKSQKYWRIAIEYLYFVFDLHIISLQWINCRLYYYIYQSNGSSIVRQWFKNRYFVWHRLNLPSIAEVDRLLVTFKTVDKLLLSMWAEFSSWALKFWLLKRIQKQSTTIGVINRTYVGNTREKRALLIWNWGKTK